MSKNYPKFGFTLIEVLLSVGMIAVISGIGAPIFARAMSKNDLDTAVFTLVESLRRAEVLASASEGDTNWGVRVITGSIVLFRGTSYAARETAYDEIYSLPTNMTFSGVDEVVMSQLTGYPNVTGSTTLTSVNGDSGTVTINSHGVVSF